VKLTIAVLAAVSLAGCSVGETLMNDVYVDEPSDLSAEFVENIQECPDAWGHLYEEWYLSIGGFKVSLLDMQFAVLDDQESIFSQVIRSQWEHQLDLGMKEEAWGRWPVSERSFRRKMFNAAVAFEAYVPEECASLSWLDPFIWRGLQDAGKGYGTEFLILSDAPRDFEWSSPYLQHWFLFWMLTPHPEVVNLMRKS
jgi:hypothetical protein